MKAAPNEVGRVVISKQGHDKARAFVVVALLDDRYVWIADGDTRKLEHPKKKQIKHLRAKPFLAEEAAAAIREKRQTADSEIRKALSALASQLAEDPIVKAVHTDSNKEECALVQE